MSELKVSIGVDAKDIEAAQTELEDMIKNAKSEKDLTDIVDHVAENLSNCIDVEVSNG